MVRPTKYQIGPYGPIYPQFENDIEGAVKYLKRVKKGEAIRVFHHPEIGWIDLPWGEYRPDNKGKIGPGRGLGFGLSKIIGKHGHEFRAIKSTVSKELFAALVYGKFTHVPGKQDRYILQNNFVKVCINRKQGTPKAYVITEYVMYEGLKKQLKKPKQA